LKKKLILLLLVILFFGIISLFSILILRIEAKDNVAFNANRAFQDVLTQANFGPRTPGSEAHANTILYIVAELKKAGWEVEIQKAEKMGHPIQNIVARRGKGNSWVILGAHYDSRFIADQDADPLKSNQPVMGANDGASGVAVLLELARILPKNNSQEIWLVFFDAEDQGKVPDWEWILGSRAFVENIPEKPDAVIVIDMIGDSNLNLYREKSSNVALTDQIWQVASELGYSDFFINEEKYSILDDHTPFLEAGFPAMDIIDFDYPYWHTSEDTIDKISPRSLEIIGTTLFTWLNK
jgi:Zn-dependent M28 family amino/carboxypeptidase